MVLSEFEIDNNLISCSLKMLQAGGHVRAKNLGGVISDVYMSLIDVFFDNPVDLLFEGKKLAKAVQIIVETGVPRARST
jgi:hypothetical protein